MIVVAVESVSSASNLWRFALRSEPTSVTTRLIEWPGDVAHARDVAIEVGSLVG